MSRKFVRISQPELKEKLKEVADQHADPDHYDDDIDLDGLLAYPNWIAYDPQISKDLAKVEFDWENVHGQGEYGKYGGSLISGIQTLVNGLTYFGVLVGGDWEYPLFFIVYWDGTKLRGYVPKEGNAWDHKRKIAFGNADIDDYTGETLDPDQKYIKAALIQKGWAVADADDLVRKKESDAAEELVDAKEILNDIRARITER